jgi:hypothetical protein
MGVYQSFYDRPHLGENGHPIKGVFVAQMCYPQLRVKSCFAIIKGVSNPSLVSVTAIYVPTKVNAAEVIEL